MDKRERPPEISIPEEVRPLYVIALPSDLAPVYVEARDVFERYRQFPYRRLLLQAELLYQDAWNTGDRHIASLARLYQADLYQRLGKRDEALAAAKISAKWLALQVPVEARYQEGVARYFGGILAYLNDDAEDAMRALNSAANLLMEAQRAWRFRGGHPQLAHCDRLQRWISDLLALRIEAWLQPDSVILPVYRWGNNDMVELDGATAVDWGMLLTADKAHERGNAWKPSSEPSEDQLPDSEMIYFAVKVPKGRKGAAPKSTSSTAESLLYVETEPEGADSARKEDRIPFDFITGERHGRFILLGNEEKSS